MTPALYTKKEAAAALRICVATLDLYTARGLLKPIRRGRKAMFLAADVDKMATCPLPTVWPAKQLDRATGRFKTVRRRETASVSPAPSQTNGTAALGSPVHL